MFLTAASAVHYTTAAKHTDVKYFLKLKTSVIYLL